MQSEFSGKVAIITGSARGIGESMARLFASKGMYVALADIDENKARELAVDLERSNGKAIPIGVDVSIRSSVDSMVHETLSAFRRIDILVNNAAINYFTGAEDVTDEEWDSILAVNVKGVYNCAKFVIPHMKAVGGGRIINISSSAGKMGGPVSSIHYSASKAAVICITKSLARHLASSNINVNSVCPGVVETDMARSLSTESRQKAIQAIPLRRFANPVEIAQAVLFLCSENSSYITGEIIDVNGGTVMD